MATAIVTDAMREKAERLADMLPTCPRGRSKRDGRGFFVIPASRPNLAHYANMLGCTCRGFDVRGVCTHQIACQLHYLRTDGARIEALHPAPLSAQHLFEEARPYGDCVKAGCTRPAENKGRRCAEHLKQLRDELGI